jgi:probable F420-dependent oxidoreductase
MPPETRPFRFGLIVDAGAATPGSQVEVAKRAEAAGVDIALCTDHVGRWGMMGLLQAVAQGTSLRVGPFVANNDLRNPIVLAQELATLDHLSGGRVEIGLGAGWNRTEYSATGIAFDPAPVRVARMMTAMSIIRGILSNGSVAHTGDASYGEMLASDLPMATQRPTPPFLVGGGRKRLLQFAAQHADTVGLNPRSMPDGTLDSRDVTADAIDRKIAWIREAANERWDELELNVALYAVDRELHSRRGPPPPRPHGVSEAEFAASPHYLGGSAAQMIETLQTRRARWGISYVAIRTAHLDAMSEVVERLANT